MSERISDEEKGIAHRGIVPNKTGDEPQASSIPGYKLVKETVETSEFPSDKVVQTRSGRKPVSDITGKGTQSTTRVYRPKASSGSAIVEGSEEIIFGDHIKRTASVQEKGVKASTDEKGVAGESVEQTRGTADRGLVIQKAKTSSKPRQSKKNYTTPLPVQGAASATPEEIESKDERTELSAKEYLDQYVNWIINNDIKEDTPYWRTRFEYEKNVAIQPKDVEFVRKILVSLRKGQTGERSRIYDAIILNTGKVWAWWMKNFGVDRDWQRENAPQGGGACAPRG
jgi:hypothetical protein